MAKESGLGWTTCSVDNSAGTAKAIKNDVTSLQFATPRGVQDVTGIDKSAYERILLLADFSITLNCVFNDATDQMFDVFKTVPSTSVPRTTTLTVSGQTLANEVLYTDFPVNRADGGELTAAIPGVLADGVVPTWS
ncbi:hypothetical protein SGFS_065860 [Streptomyces graminofaciens]|uniref:Major tail protein n=1 Tax=Streptomyces graminofaciens TaxID=68212 RepID=A0ABM7FGG2_9ACTN|nr:hypothetical protein [Streptomyces graminofaciens]BBC35292.1 hypothetical protein SGFS_065860 [Streptomyces graminofaciens]